MDTWMRLGMAFVGFVSIYLGYKLFCDGTQEGRRLTTFVAGALLAIFGLGVVLAEVREIRSVGREARHRMQRSRSTEEGSFSTPVQHLTIRSADRIV